MPFGSFAGKVEAVVVVTDTPTGGWLRDPYRDEDSDSRRQRIRAERERLGIVEPLAALEREIQRAGKPRARVSAQAARAARDSAYAEQLRLLTALDAMDRMGKQRRVRAAMLMLVAAQ